MSHYRLAFIEINILRLLLKSAILNTYIAVCMQNWCSGWRRGSSSPHIAREGWFQFHTWMRTKLAFDYLFARITNCFILDNENYGNGTFLWMNIYAIPILRNCLNRALPLEQFWFNSQLIHIVHRRRTTDLRKIDIQYLNFVSF